MPAYHSGMDTIAQLSEAARRLTPDQLRDRLVQIDQEARIIRALLRATLQANRPKSSERQGGQTV